MPSWLPAESPRCPRGHLSQKAGFAVSLAPHKLRPAERAPSPVTNRRPEVRKKNSSKAATWRMACKGRTPMPLSIDRRRALALLGSVVAAPRLGRAAEAWPIRSVKYVNGFPAGGATDTLSRLICQKMSELSGQSFVVENKA